jgi:methylmalonyl-CoA/ethylmalonyl-CoA epimerase
MPARASAASIATAPRSMALSEANAPESFPIGVRADETMTDPGMAGSWSWVGSGRRIVPIRPERILPGLGRIPNMSSVFTEIDHVAIAVRDLDAAVAYYGATFGCEVEHREVVERDGVEEALLRVADSYVQLLTPTRDDSPVAKYLETKGEGIHHVGYRVADCAAALERVKAQGHRVIDEAPRPGSRGTTVAFVHPKTAFGTLIELVEE